MLALISGFAQDDDRIRTVLMNGSRANPSAKRDIFQDYDIANFVTDVDPFRDYEFIRSHFGEAIMVQTPEDKESPPAAGDGRYNYNMQLVDGNRIDLSFFPLDKLQELVRDSLTVVLFDKDGRLGDLMPPSESSYFLSEPTERLYVDCCDEFLFGLGSHIPKTLWRRSLPLLHFYMDVVLRRALVTMLGWEVGTRTGFDRSVGKSGSKLKEYLSPEQWRQFLRTYPDSKSTISGSQPWCSTICSWVVRSTSKEPMVTPFPPRPGGRRGHSWSMCMSCRRMRHRYTELSQETSMGRALVWTVGAPREARCATIVSYLVRGRAVMFEWRQTR